MQEPWKVLIATATRILIPITALMFIGFNPSTASANPLGQLTAKQGRSLKALGIKIAVPTYVPSGFKVVSVKTEPCPAKAQRSATGVCRFGPTYRILYRNSQQTCFAIDEVGGGLGGPDAEFVLPVEVKLLGKTSLGFGITPGEGKPATAKQLATPQQQIWSWPAGSSPYYQISTVENREGCGANRSLTPLEVKKTLQSLTWL